MKKTNKKLKDSLRRDAFAKLLFQIRTVKTIAGIEHLLDLIMTSDEKEVVLRRMIIADMLENKFSYRQIEKSLGVSHITISKVRDILECRGYGKNPNRRKVYSVINSKNKKRTKPLLGYYKGAASIV